MSSLASDLRFGARSLFRSPAATVVMIVSLAATLQPALRAARVDPAVALRND